MIIHHYFEKKNKDKEHYFFLCKTTIINTTKQKCLNKSVFTCSVTFDPIDNQFLTQHF